MRLSFKNTVFPLLSALFFAGIAFSSCINERISDDPTLKLTFSTDTLFFDTIFTTIGSSTAKFKVYNPHRQNVKIAAIGLATGQSSPYRINVDGVSGTQFTDVELRAKDSLYIFVEIKIDPQQTNAPVFVKDSIVFHTNTNRQDVKLLAYGQNMTVLRRQTFKNDTTLTDEKPYLIDGDLVVDTARTLTLAPGCRLYFYNRASLVVHGNLVAEGTRQKPILLRGVRTDRIFEHVPYNFVSNQWGGVLLLHKAGKHTFNFVTMNSGYVGIFLKNEDRNARPTLEITNSRIHNFLKYGLVVQNGDATVANTEISNTGAHAVYLNGGKHTFVHTTIANYFNNADVLLQPSGREGNAAFTIMELNRSIPMETAFTNCIVSGSNANELEILTRAPDRYNGKFSHSYIRKADADTVAPMYNAIRWYKANDTVFVNTRFEREKQMYYNFMLDSVSPARNIGDYNAAAAYPEDLNGNNRLADGKPDAGAYEWKQGK